MQRNQYTLMMKNINMFYSQKKKSKLSQNVYDFQFSQNETDNVSRSEPDTAWYHCDGLLTFIPSFDIAGT